MPRTSERGGPQTRARILEVANGLFLDRGYDAVTVAEVARAAGVSSVTVFNHFPRKEDLFLDRADDAAEFLRSAVRYRAAGVDVVESLRQTVLRLFEAAHPLSGMDELSVPFFRTVAQSSALVARARELAAQLEKTLVDELEADETFRGEGALLAAFFISGYTTVLVETARRRLAGASPEDVAADHRNRLERLFGALRQGIELN